VSAAGRQRLGGGVHVMRRLITYVLLFALVCIAASGLAGLIGRLLDLGNRVVVDDVTSLALWLAFTLVGGPLAALLWWLSWKWLVSLHDRESVLWALYLAGMYTVSLITAVTALLSLLSSLVTGTWRPAELAVGLVWGGLWLWHRWMWRHPARGPVRLPGLAPVIGSFFGLAVGAGAGVSALGALLDAAFLGAADAVSIGNPWWHPVLQSVVWAVGGGLIWWWHWVHDGVRRLRTGFAQFVLVVIAGVGAAVLCLAGIATALYVALRLPLDPGAPTLELLDPLGTAVSSALIGAVVWIYHRGIVYQDVPGDVPESASVRTDVVRQATRLATSGVGLAAAAGGLGIVVNSILATIASPLADSGVRPLLLAGLSALLVGGPVWWALWRPTAPADAAWNSSPARRVYLVIVFGVSAVVALITLLVIGYRVFEFTLGDTSGDSLLERVRAAVGLLTATTLVAVYHFAVWRHDRPAPGPATAPVQTIGTVILVTGADAAPLVKAIEAACGAEVSVWPRADADADATSPEQVAAALTGVTGDRVLLVTGAAGGIDVIPLRS
jgi:hypothetical protein